MTGEKQRFTLTADHIKLLRRMYVEWQDCEAGAPAIDCKRPYGNSDVTMDIAVSLEWPLLETRDGQNLTAEQETTALRLHRETQTALQIVLATGAFEPGEYESDEYDINWRKEKAG